MPEGSTSWITETRRAVDQASNAAQAQSDYDALTSADEGLDTALADLAQLAQAAALGRGAWWPGVDAPPNLWTNLQSAQQDLGRRHVASVLHVLGQFRTMVRDVVRDRWKGHVASQAGNAVELRDLVQVLAGAEELRDVARNLDEALGRLSRSQKDLPNAQALRALGEVTEFLAALEQRLPAGVKAFVSAATHGGAALELLDDGVRAWLVDNGAIHNFRVIPGRPQEAKRG